MAWWPCSTLEFKPSCHPSARRYWKENKGWWAYWYLGLRTTPKDAAERLQLILQEAEDEARPRAAPQRTLRMWRPCPPQAQPRRGDPAGQPHRSNAPGYHRLNRRRLRRPGKLPAGLLGTWGVPLLQGDLSAHGGLHTRMRYMAVVFLLSGIAACLEKVRPRREYS